MIGLVLVLLLLAWPVRAQMESAPGVGPNEVPVRGASNLYWRGLHNAQPEQALIDGVNIYPPSSSGVYTEVVSGASHVIRCPLSIAAVDTMIFEITEGSNVISFDSVCYGWAGKSPPTFTVSGYDEVICHSRTPTVSNSVPFTCNSILNAGNTSAPTFVQAKFGAKVTSGTTFSVTMTAPLTAGNSVGCFLLYNGSGSISTVLDGTNTYTSIAGPTAIGSAKVQSFKLIGLTGSPSTITATASAAVTGAGIECVEVAGASTVDVNALNVQSAFNGSVTDSVTSTNVNTTNPNELLVGMSLTTAGFQINAGTGQTLATHDTTGTGWGFIIEYKTTAAVGSYASTFTSTDSGNDSYGSAGLAFH